MQNPALELGADIGTVLMKNLIRAFGEADQDTISEQIRALVGHHQYGKTVFGAACVVVPVVFYRHIVGPLR